MRDVKLYHYAESLFDIAFVRRMVRSSELWETSCKMFGHYMVSPLFVQDTLIATLFKTVNSKITTTTSMYVYAARFVEVSYCGYTILYDFEKLSNSNLL